MWAILTLESSNRIDSNKYWTNGSSSYSRWSLPLASWLGVRALNRYQQATSTFLLGIRRKNQTKKLLKRRCDKLRQSCHHYLIRCCFGFASKSCDKSIPIPQPTPTSLNSKKNRKNPVPTSSAANIEKFSFTLVIFYFIFFVAYSPIFGRDVLQDEATKINWANVHASLHSSMF